MLPLLHPSRHCNRSHSLRNECSSSLMAMPPCIFIRTLQLECVPSSSDDDEQDEQH